MHLWHLACQAAPISTASDSEQINYFFSGAVERTGKHNLHFDLAQSSHSFKDEYSGVDSKAKRTDSRFTYEIVDFYRPQYSYFAALDYDNKMGESFSPVQHHVIAGPLGVRVPINYHHANLQYLYASYVPSFDYLVRDRLEPNGQVLTTNESAFRQASRVDAKVRVYED